MERVGILWNVEKVATLAWVAEAYAAFETNGVLGTWRSEVRTMRSR